MTTNTDDEVMRAFPSVRNSSAAERPDKVAHDGPLGMTLRDWFAGKAMQALLFAHAEESWAGRIDMKRVAEQAFEQAELMRQESKRWQDIDRQLAQSLKDPNT